MNALRWIQILALGLGLLGAARAAEPVPQPLVAGGFRDILARHAGQPLVVAFWSLECSHCSASLKTLAEFRRRHPELAVVLVSTDDPSSATSAARHARELGFADSPQWIFADPLPERLRREIDPRWWGELPRTVLVDTLGVRSAQAGALDGALLAAWWAKAR